MAFTHLDIKEQRARKTVLLFLLLFAYYFIGFFILSAFVQFIFAIYVFSGIGFTIQHLQSLILWSVIIAAGAAGIHWLSSVIGGMERILAALHAQPLDQNDRYHHRVQDIIDELQLATGGKQIRAVVLPTIAMNAFAVSDMHGNSVIGVTEGLIARLNRLQLESVLAHEMAHVLNKDAFVVTVACSLFAVYAQLLSFAEAATENTGQYGNRQAAVPAIFIPLLWLLSMGAYVLNILISRQREYMADATAVELTRDPLSLAEALYIVSRSWRGIGYADSNLSPLFIMSPEDDGLDNIESWFADMFSTHPPVAKRLEVLLQLGKIDMATFESAVEQKQLISEQKKSADAVGAGLPSPDTMSEGTSPLPETTWWTRSTNNQWQGPFTALQLTSNPFITPETWVTRNQAVPPVHAGSDPLLSDLFQLRLAGKMLSPYQCPRCNQMLTKVDYEGTQIARCYFCGGSLVEEAQLFRIFAREEKQFTDSLKQQADEIMNKHRFNPTHAGLTPSELVTRAFPVFTCPKCRIPMVRMPYSLEYFVVVDRCYSCQLIWFDKEELELLQIMVEERQT